MAYNLRYLPRVLLPRAWNRRHRAALLRLDSEEAATLADRVQYYHQVREPFALSDAEAPFQLNLLGKQTSYQLDLYDVLRCFDRHLHIARLFGDVTEVPAQPTIVKSRPIGPLNQNSILLNLNRARHFYFVRDHRRFEEKQDRLVWRGRAFREHRKSFLRQFYDHPRCDVGHHHRKHSDTIWAKPHLSVHEQLAYKFILSLEGNDVASNLKWILSSHSLCFMPRPRFETWFMEGRLQPGVHYVELRDDCSDLEEKMDYYLTHANEAQAIIAAANQWVRSFRNPVTELRIALLVVWRYGYLSGQIAEPPPHWYSEKEASNSSCLRTKASTTAGSNCLFFSRTNSSSASLTLTESQ
jgi:hypothetical protein